MRTVMLAHGLLLIHSVVPIALLEHFPQLQVHRIPSSVSVVMREHGPRLVLLSVSRAMPVHGLQSTPLVAWVVTLGHFRTQQVLHRSCSA